MFVQVLVFIQLAMLVDGSFTFSKGSWWGDYEEEILYKFVSYGFCLKGLGQQSRKRYMSWYVLQDLCLSISEIFLRFLEVVRGGF